jgi:hypothetical protein
MTDPKVIRVDTPEAIQTVAIAAELNREIRQLTNKLDEQKAVLRELAIAARSLEGADRVEFSSVEGVCVIAFPQNKIDFIEPQLFTPDYIQEFIPQVIWDALFVRRVAINRDKVHGTLAILTKDQRRWVDGVLVSSASTPTVTLPK